jgi:hypothetical protein
MLINRLKEGIRLFSEATSAAGQGASDREVGARGAQSTVSRLPDVSAWMSPSLVLTTARTTSGM